MNDSSGKHLRGFVRDAHRLGFDIAGADSLDLIETGKYPQIAFRPQERLGYHGIVDGGIVARRKHCVNSLFLLVVDI